VITQIRRLDIVYMDEQATMIVIRNVTFIIEYEKIKNESRY